MLEISKKCIGPAFTMVFGLAACGGEYEFVPHPEDTESVNHATQRPAKADVRDNRTNAEAEADNNEEQQRVGGTWDRTALDVTTAQTRCIPVESNVVEQLRIRLDRCNRAVNCAAWAGCQNAGGATISSVVSDRWYQLVPQVLLECTINGTARDGGLCTGGRVNVRGYSLVFDQTNAIFRHQQAAQACSPSVNCEAWAGCVNSIVPQGERIASVIQIPLNGRAVCNAAFVDRDGSENYLPID